MISCVVSCDDSLESGDSVVPDLPEIHTLADIISNKWVQMTARRTTIVCRAGGNDMDGFLDGGT